MIPGVPLLAQKTAVDQPASQLFNQPVGPTAAETGALEVSQQLLGNCSACASGRMKA